MPPAAALSARRSRNIDWVEVVRSPEVAIRMVAVLRLIDLNRTFALCCANSHRRAVYVDQPARRTRPSLESAAVTFSRRRAYGPPAPAERHGCLTIELRRDEITWLVRHRWLAPESCSDLNAVRRALYRFFDDALQ